MSFALQKKCGQMVEIIRQLLRLQSQLVLQKWFQSLVIVTQVPLVIDNKSKPSGISRCTLLVNRNDIFNYD